MKKYIMLAAAALSLAACSDQKFHIEGNITEAADSVLYLENIGLEGPAVLDSVKLPADGRFAFSGERTEAPEFYRLRIGRQLINVAVDSTETVTVRASYPQMATIYDVTGDDNQKIKELALMQIDLHQRAMAVSQDERFTVKQSNDSILSMVRRYKEQVKRQYIFPDPSRPYAYFALFQTLGNMLLFNPRTNRDDIKVFAAVATSWDTYYPNAERGANLHNIAIEGMKNVRANDRLQANAIPADKVQTTGLIDITLPDNSGRERSLKELKGQVVLLDFHLFALKDSPERILLLRELYNKYHAQGFEIYQVSLDPDEHFWKQQTAALPWVSVRDGRGTGAPELTIYNVQGIPEYFLIDRSNSIVGRSETIRDIHQAIKSLL